MARPRYPKHTGPLPPALPPETRTVGQLVAETIRLYGRRFWAALALGLALAAIDQIATGFSRTTWLVFTATGGGALLSAAYVGACVIASDRQLDRRTLVTAWAAGLIAFVPFPFLLVMFVLPGVAWLALVGLVVPVVALEGRGLREAFSRAVLLARADYVHAVGSLATLVLTFFLTRLVLFFLLRGLGDAADRVAAFLADLVLSPLLFLGAALLYYDQAARADRVRGAGRASAG